MSELSWGEHPIPLPPEGKVLSPNQSGKIQKKTLPESLQKLCTKNTSIELTVMVTLVIEGIFAFHCCRSVSKKREQAEKLHCILCYFDRVASDKCNLSGVITYRRQVRAVL